MEPRKLTRRVKCENGVYTLEGKREAAITEELCHHCGIEVQCAARKKINALNKKSGATVSVRNCDEFTVKLPFQSLKGLDQPAFNTFRLGLAIAGRVKHGDKVIMIHSRDGDRVVGPARVTAVHTGKMLEMCDLHAHDNHFLVPSRPGEVTKEMLRILRNAYGSNYAHEGKDVTVIYLVPLYNG